MPDAPAVVVWGIPELPLAFYLGRPVTRVGSEAEMRVVLERDPRAVVVASETNWARRRSGEIALTPAPASGERPRVVLVGRGPKR
jgi:hypothetical protein